MTLVRHQEENNGIEPSIFHQCGRSTIELVLQKKVVPTTLTIDCSVRDSNPWPSAHKTDALPTELTEQ